MFEYARAIRKSGKDMGYECYIQADQVLAWLAVHAPELQHLVEQ